MRVYYSLQQYPMQGPLIKALCLASLFLFSGCARSTEKPLPAIETLACVPKNEPSPGPAFSIVSAMETAEHIRLRILVKAGEEAAVFQLPVYRMSAGRWLIGNAGRTYLIDELCREYRLKDRKSVTAAGIPLDGKIPLRPEESYEADLLFPKLIHPLKLDPAHPEKPVRLVLVYEKRVLAFSLSPEF